MILPYALMKLRVKLMCPEFPLQNFLYFRRFLKLVNPLLKCYQYFVKILRARAVSCIVLEKYSLQKFTFLYMIPLCFLTYHNVIWFGITLIKNHGRCSNSHWVEHNLPVLNQIITLMFMIFTSWLLGFTFDNLPDTFTVWFIHNSSIYTLSVFLHYIIDIMI